MCQFELFFYSVEHLFVYHALYSKLCSEIGSVFKSFSFLFATLAHKCVYCISTRVVSVVSFHSNYVQSVVYKHETEIKYGLKFWENYLFTLHILSNCLFILNLKCRYSLCHFGSADWKHIYHPPFHRFHILIVLLYILDNNSNGLPSIM